MLWWEEITGLLQSQPALLKQEVSLRLGLIVTMMEQLTSDDALTFSDMETILSEVHTTLNESLQMCIEGKADCKSDFPLFLSFFPLFNKFNESLTKSIRQTQHFVSLTNLQFYSPHSRVHNKDQRAADRQV